jgi:hypothetical protein
VGGVYVSAGEVTTLSHEAGDYTVELGSLVTEALGASAKLTEVVRGPGDNIIVELEHNATPVVLWMKAKFGQSSHRYGDVLLQDWGRVVGVEKR